MAVYIDGNETEDSSKRVSERLASMHKLFMKEAYKGLVEEFSTGKLHSHSLTMAHWQITENHGLMHTTQCNMVPSMSACIGVWHTNHVPHAKSQASPVNMASMTAKRQKLNVANLNVTHSVLQMKESQDICHQLHITELKLPYAYTLTFKSVQDFKSQATQASLTCLTAVEDEAVAANLAITHPVLQAMEWVDVWNRGPGHVNVTAATAKGAQLLREALYISFGIHGRFLVHLTPENTTLDPTLKYSVVSNAVSAGSFSAKTMHTHRLSLVQKASAHGKNMYAKQLIQTPSNKLKIHVQ